MARVATKAADNVWYKARIDAAEKDVRLKSREGAAEILGMCESAVADTELGTMKCMPPDKAAVMAKAYDAPQLIPYYCMHECPLGGYVAVSDEVVGVEAMVLRLLRDLESALELKKQLLDVAYDGKITENEKSMLKTAFGVFDNLSRTLCQAKTLENKM